MKPVTLPDTERAPLLSARLHTPFVAELTDLNNTMNVNGAPLNHALWNMLLSHRDLTLWCRHGMKPHKGWKVSDCKKYFGLKGSGEALLAQFEALKAEVDRLR